LDPTLTLIFSILLIVTPAYAANGMALIFGGGKPLDGGRKFFDGKRLLGDGKTVKGTCSGLIFGFIAALTVGLTYLSLSADSTLALPGYIAIGFCSAVGAIGGDLLGSFIKRRMGLPPGSPAPFIDQFDFILMALLLTFLVNQALHLLDFNFILVVSVLVFTPFAHLIGNYIVYRAGRKKHPW